MGIKRTRFARISLAAILLSLAVPVEANQDGEPDVLTEEEAGIYGPPPGQIRGKVPIDVYRFSIDNFADKYEPATGEQEPEWYNDRSLRGGHTTKMTKMYVRVPVSLILERRGISWDKVPTKYRISTTEPLKKSCGGKLVSKTTGNVDTSDESIESKQYIAKEVNLIFELEDDEAWEGDSECLKDLVYEAGAAPVPPTSSVGKIKFGLDIPAHSIFSRTDSSSSGVTKKEIAIEYSAVTEAKHDIKEFRQTFKTSFEIAGYVSTGVGVTRIALSKAPMLVKGTLTVIETRDELSNLVGEEIIPPTTPSGVGAQQTSEAIARFEKAVKKVGEDDSREVWIGPSIVRAN